MAIPANEWLHSNPLYRITSGLGPTSPEPKQHAFLQQKKPTGRSWSEHFLLLSAVSEAVGGADDLLLESVIKYAKPDFKQAVMVRVNTMREDTRRQARNCVTLPSLWIQTPSVMHQGRRRNGIETELVQEENPSRRSK